MRKENSESPVASKKELNDLVTEIMSEESATAYSLFSFVYLKLRQFNLTSQVEVHEIFVEAYLRGINVIEKGGTIERPSAWLKGTAFNIIREYSRKTKKEYPSDSSLIDNLPNNEFNKFNEAEEIEKHLNAVQKSLTILRKENQDEAKLIYLKNINGLTWKQIREILIQEEGDNAPSIETLRKRGSRALHRLRKIFSEIKPDQEQDSV